MIEFPQDFKEFLQLANSAGIRYLVVGGYAVGYHGHPRATGDLDVWIAVDPENARLLADALKTFGFDLPELTPELFMSENKIIRMGVPPMRLEILTHIDGVEFNDCYPRRQTETYGNLTVHFISREDLLQNKRASGRTKDLADYEELS